MSRFWGWVLLLGWVVMPTASAQDGMLGLPLVVQKSGWARYATQSSEGPTEVVFKVGPSGTHKGKKGQWLLMEVDAPGVGRITLHFLVAGGRFTPDNLLLVRTEVPGEKTQESEPPKDDAAQALPPLKRLRKHVVKVAGRELEVTEYALGEALTAGWSPSVPGLGLTSISGDNPMRLVAFGVGGDPWKGAGPGLPLWPEPAPEKK
ncbi:MAG: hypothetical protein ABW123_09970 [Cystobacter sp.]